jgi:hypothetical protein
MAKVTCRMLVVGFVVVIVVRSSAELVRVGCFPSADRPPGRARATRAMSAGEDKLMDISNRLMVGVARRVFSLTSWNPVGA